MSVASVLAFGLPVAATAEDTTTTTDTSTTTTTTAPVEEPPATDPAEEAPTTESTTTAPTTTEAADPAFAVPAQPGGRGGDRGAEQVQLTPPPPPPPTTLPTFGLPGNSGSGRRVVYSKSQQQLWVIDSNGVVIKNHLVSGKQVSCDPTPGHYQVFSRSRYTFAIQNPSIIWGYMVRFAHGCRGGNIGFHEIPTNKNTGYKVQSVSQLGTPLSGGCVRQSVPDAIWMWNWAYVGTKVVVLP